MEVRFMKYTGAGNDFVIVHDKDCSFPANDIRLIEDMCDRRFGIGADGLMLLQPHDKYDFRMVYFNSDGRESTMCGNGGRCIVAFAFRSKIIGENTVFEAIDGLHEAKLIAPEHVNLKMIDVASIETGDDYCFLNTGSPHYVVFGKDLEELDIVPEAHKIRYGDRFKSEGTNVNFVSHKNGFAVRTYERGVEDETFACGTGVVASVIASHVKGLSGKSEKVKVKGGELAVSFETNNKTQFSNVWLEGPAQFVFVGTYEF